MNDDVRPREPGADARSFVDPRSGRSLELVPHGGMELGGALIRYLQDRHGASLVWTSPGDEPSNVEFLLTIPRPTVQSICEQSAQICDRALALVTRGDVLLTQVRATRMKALRLREAARARVAATATLRRLAESLNGSSAR
jgi:hypothetical protein